jgi:hypothetical protein
MINRTFSYTFAVYFFMFAIAWVFEEDQVVEASQIHATKHHGPVHETRDVEFYGYGFALVSRR